MTKKELTLIASITVLFGLVIVSVWLYPQSHTNATQSDEPANTIVDDAPAIHTQVEHDEKTNEIDPDVYSLSIKDPIQMIGISEAGFVALCQRAHGEVSERTNKDGKLCVVSDDYYISVYSVLIKDGVAEEYEQMTTDIQYVKLYKKSLASKLENPGMRLQNKCPTRSWKVLTEDHAVLVSVSACRNGEGTIRGIRK